MNWIRCCLPVFFSSTIFSSLHSRQSVHSAHFLHHSLKCCAHRCWVQTVTPFFFLDFFMKTFRSIFPESLFLYVLLTLSSFSMHPLFTDTCYLFTYFWRMHTHTHTRTSVLHVQHSIFFILHSHFNPIVDSQHTSPHHGLKVKRFSKAAFGFISQTGKWHKVQNWWTLYDLQSDGTT